MERNDQAATMAAAILRFRRARTDVLPGDLFGEPAWEVLLELFVADALGTSLTAREISTRANIAQSVMARWLIHLDRSALVIGDGDGDLDDLLTLSGKGFEAVERLMATALFQFRDLASA